MWATTKPITMMPVIAMTYFLPTRGGVEVEQEGLAPLLRCGAAAVPVTGAARRWTASVPSSDAFRRYGGRRDGTPASARRNSHW